MKYITKSKNQIIKILKNKSIKKLRLYSIKGFVENVEYVEKHKKMSNIMSLNR